MALTVLITLTTAGADTGPFFLYSNVDSYITPFESSVPKVSLTSGYTSTLVPNGTSIIRVLSANGLCSNYVDLPIVGVTTTTTTSTSTSTTTSTTSTTTSTSTTTINAPYSIYVEYTLGISGASWEAVFDNNNGDDGTFTVNFGSGTTITKTIAYFNDTMSVTVGKLNNGGIAQDSGSVQIYKAPSTLLSTFSFNVGDNVSVIPFGLTGLSIGDTVYAVINEG